VRLRATIALSRRLVRGSLVGAGVGLLGLVAAAVARGDAVTDSVPMPPKRGISYDYDGYEQSFARPIARALDPVRLVRRVTGRREAENVDAADRVQLPSTWWQPRVGYKPVSVAAMLTGPGPGTGPAPGPWTIVKAKTEGVSRGFEMKDATGQRFAVKFDPPNFPELGSAADVICSHLFWAAGYNVPDNTIAWFRREDLRIGKDAKHLADGRDVPITEPYLYELLKGLTPEADGRYRVIASRYLPGKPIGEWRFTGCRKGDVEDRVPHELRREIRGMFPIAAWVNHTDCSARNTLDTYVTDGGRSFVRHWLLDFSGCLGSASIGPQPLEAGHEYFVDWGAAGRKLVTLGIPRQRWEKQVDPKLRGVGIVDAATFDPDAWKTYIPNPAFDDRTERDERWGARIVAAMSDDLIRAAVELGHLSDPRSSEYLVRILEERRDAVARRWLAPAEIERVRAESDTTGESAAAPAHDAMPPRDVARTPADGSAASLDTTARSDDPPAPGDSTSNVPPATAPPADRGALAPPDTSVHAGTPERLEAEPHLGLGGRLRRAAWNFLDDGWVVVSSPARLHGTGFLWLGLVVGTEVALYANDQEIHDAILRNRNAAVMKTVIQVGDDVEPIGFMGRTNPYYFGAAALGYAVRVAPLREIPTEILESHFIAGGIRNVAKFVVGRRHPYEDQGPRAFDFGHGTSFPSGHTSVLFELATITSAHVHFLPYSVAAYSVASALAVQRISSENHWPSDVFIAAAYGTLTARTVVRLHRERTLQRFGWNVVPWTTPQGDLAGLALTTKF